MKKTLSLVLALLMAFSVVFAVPFAASAQECAWTLYVNGQPYSTSASYYVSGQLKMIGTTVYLNGFTGNTIEAIPGGSYGDDDAPVLNIDVTGTCTLFGGTLDDGTYGALYAEPRAGGAGKDSRVYVRSTNNGTLNITKRDNSYSQSSSTPKAYHAVSADEVVLGGTLNLNITTELYGVGTEASPKEVCGISASSLIAISNTGINNINVSAGTTTIPRPSGIVSEYPSYAKVYGIYSKDGPTGVRVGGAGGYTNVDISRTNTKASDSCCIKASNSIDLSHFATAVYLNAGKYAVSSPETITNAVNLKLFAADQDDFHYAAYLPKDITSNTALKEIKAKDVISSKLYKIGETPKNDTNYRSAGSCYVRSFVKQTLNLSNNAFYNFDTFVDDISYVYFNNFVPKAGYWCSAVSNVSLDIDSIQSECSLPTKPGMAQYIYATASNIPRYIVGYVYDGPKVQSYASDSTVDAVGVVNFNVAPTGSDEGYTYQWGYGDSFTEITDSVNVTGAKTKTLTITGTASNPNCSLPFNGQAIVCKVSNVYGTYTTEPAVFTVKHSKSGDYTSDQENHTYQCYCGEVIPEKHTAKTTTTKATLTADGKTVTTCTVCEKTIKTTVIPKVGSIKLSATKYNYDGKAKTPTVTVADSDGKTIAAANYTVAYKNNTNAGTASVTVTFKGDYYTGSKTLSFSILPGVTTKLTATPTSTTVKLSWNAVPGATAYRVFLYNTSTKKYTTLKNTTATSYTATGLKNAASYKFAVRAYASGVWADSFKTVTATTCPGVTSKIVTASSASAIKLTWKAVSGATGYRVFLYNTSTKKYTKLKDTTATSYTASKLNSGTNYKFAVKAYKIIDGKVYWADSYKEITATTKPGTPTLKVTAGSKKATLFWNKQTGASGYVVYMATSKTGKYSRVAVVKGGSTVKYTKTGLTTGKTYYFKVAAYKTVSGKNIYGSFSTVKYAKIK